MKKVMTNDKQRLVELLQEANKEAWNLINMSCCEEKLKLLDKVNEIRADYLLANGVIVPTKDIEMQKTNIFEYEREFDEVAKDLFKIDEDYTGGAKVWVRTDVYKKLMRILALSNHLVKVLKILLIKEEAALALNDIQNGNSCDGGAE